jgi:hypothetical protein
MINTLDRNWSIPPVDTDPSLPSNTPIIPHPDPTNPTLHSMRIPLRQGIPTIVNMATPWLFQNVNENEDDFIEFSFHGEVDGTWNKMNIGNFVKVNRPIYFLNRTDKEVLYMALMS